MAGSLVVYAAGERGDAALREAVRGGGDLTVVALAPVERSDKPWHGCRWLFLDRSKNHSRRWCSMEECGTSAKKRRYIERRRALTES